jgi:hypothetical protein
MSELPKILVSSVIRATNKGDGHGGLYIVDLENSTYEQVLDWKYPHISWDSGGGDRGLRGLTFYKGELYAAGARSIFVFDENYELVRQYRHNLIDGTHELTRWGNMLFSISNEYDMIMAFDLEERQWPVAMQCNLDEEMFPLDPESPLVPEVDENGNTIADENDPNSPKWMMVEKRDTMHLDSLSVHEDWLFYAGSKTENMYALNLHSAENRFQKLHFPNTHNARPWKDGLVFNRSVESDTCYQVGNKLVKQWKTPLFPKPIQHISPGDHARVGYTRGMVLTKDHVIVGTSPGSVHAFSLDSNIPVRSVYLSDDVRNSVCGMCAMEEPEESYINWSMP